MAHSDQSRWAGENRILKHLGQETLDKVKKGELHAQLINLWRPLRGQAWDMPLAVADSRTVSRGENGKPKDWIESELRYPTWSGQTLAIYSNPEHRWYYYSGLVRTRLSCSSATIPRPRPGHLTRRSKTRRRLRMPNRGGRSRSESSLLPILS